MDIALVLDKIRPGAAWRMSDSYENLAATWEDTEQTLPTLAEIEAAWAEIQAEASAPITPLVDCRFMASNAGNVSRIRSAGRREIVC